jgi:hypothetical protein
MKHPERIIAIITQNGNAYVEGLIKEWEPWQGHRQGIVALPNYSWTVVRGTNACE